MKEDIYIFDERGHLYTLTLVNILALYIHIVE